VNAKIFMRLQSVLLVVVLPTILLCPSSLGAQTAPPTNTACRLSVLRVKLVLPRAGWAIVGPAGGGDCAVQHIYWTDDNGQVWRDITPRDMPTRKIGQVFFLDRVHGSLLSTNALSEEENARYYLLSTEDGGQHWRTQVLQAPRGTFSPRQQRNISFAGGYLSPIQMFFSDPEHGWVFWRYAVTHTLRYALLSTTDSGRTWKPLPEPPGGGPLQFTSAREGWMIGGPEEVESISASMDTQLWLTRDAGGTWVPVPVPVPKESAEQSAYLVALKFKNMREGLVAAGVQGTEGSVTFVNCFTRDGGKTWQFSQFDAESAQPSLGSEHIFWSVYSPSPERHHAGKVSVQKDNNPISFGLPADVSSASRLIDLDFLDDTNAWATYSDGGQARLVATIDGGQTSKLMASPLPTQELLLH